MRLLAQAAAICLALTSPALASGCQRPETVHFARGASSAEVAGGVPRGERDCFTIAVGAGQTLAVTQTPGPDDNVVFQLYRPGWRIGAQGDVVGRTLRGAGEGEDARAWTGRTPVAGAYLMVVGTTRGGGGYRIRIAVR